MIRIFCWSAGMAFALASSLRAALDAPVSPNAQPGVAITLQFFENIAGRYILAGQQEIAWDESRKDEDINYIIQNTGRTPAVRGFDWLKYTENSSNKLTYRATERAIAWAQQGGIVTFCIHMFMSLGSTNGQPQFYTPGANGNPTGTNFDIRQAIVAGTPEHAEFVAKMDVCAEELAKLRDAGVTVIWRPFHECGGTWFWWSRYGAESFKAAWRMMFERYTQVHHLNNLIWCFNPTDSFSVMQNWYPGDEFVDMISLDVYPSTGTHPTYAADSKRMRDFRAGRKVVVMSENGAIPNIDQLFAEGGLWGYFCTWNGFINDVSRNSAAFINEAFNHEKVITLDELPALWTANTPAIAVAPQNQGVEAGAAVNLSVAATGTPAPTLQWRRNGLEIAGANGANLLLPEVQAASAGLYDVAAARGIATSTSAPAIVSVNQAAKVSGAAVEHWPNIVVGSGENQKTYDQVELQGTAAAIRADFSADPALNQIVRMSYIDLDDDIVQVEFSGPGTLSLVLEDVVGSAAPPANYNQASVSYVKGRANIVITGANEFSNVTVFTVGRATAINQALFRDDVTYDGIADIGSIAITTTNGRFGGVRASNAHFAGARGYVGVYAPGVAFDGPLFIGNVDAAEAATPVIQVGSVSDARIPGGDLGQTNHRAVQVSGLTKLNFTAGTDSHGNLIAAKTNRAVLQWNGVNVTADLVVNP